ncbi:MAG: polysaccharide deacetylase family protein [Sphingomonadales bacterium]|nr:polysaccharide deacetylase family protein [Sphingomonadales bacterium]
MVQLYITIDTEYAAGFPWRDDRRENFARSIAGQVADGEAGIFYQMDVMDRHGIKAVFFVDPLPALVWGVEAIADIVGPIVARGHDVQLHAHTEWLAIAGSQNPLGRSTGVHMREFTFEQQCLILEYARDVLIAAGAPQPVAFRAGNYGADDNTLRALAALGIAYDSSHTPGIAASDCRISLGPEDRTPVAIHGVTEVPVSCIAAPRGGRRHFQLTALSDGEIRAALRHARQQPGAPMTLVSHSFELLSRDRSRRNAFLVRRFERLCAWLGREPGVSSATYADNPPLIHATNEPAALLPHSFWRTGWRYAEQAAANALYGAR